MLKCVITGCGHSGTRWLANVLMKAGLHAAHEQVFGAAFNPTAGTHVCEVSWTAAAWPERLKDSAVFMVVRHPLRIIRSFERERWFEANSGHQGIVRRILGDEVDTVDYVIEWWRLCRSVARSWWRIEDTGVFQIAKIAQECNVRLQRHHIERALLMPRNIGTTVRDGVEEPSLSWVADHPRYEELRRDASEYGYSLPTREELLAQEEHGHAI